jgi:dephospho-CoA kinase
MLKIALTGGIGSGKSTVSEMFAEFGVTIADADVIAQQLTTIDTPAYQQIVARFGEDILMQDKELDRQKLRALVFNSKPDRIWLEALLHPAIRQELYRQANESSAEYALLVIPLLVESGHFDQLDRILVVDLNPKTQIERATMRDNADLKQIQDIMRAQCSRQERLDAADDVLKNNGDLDALRTEVEKFHQQYLELAKAKVS